jgi:hypothetical protein
VPGGRSAQASRAALAALPAPGSQSIVYTATLTLQTRSVSTVAAKATALATAAGGYVSSENTILPRAPGNHSMVSLQLKIPVAAYPSMLGKLSGLAQQVSLAQQAQDVTQAVADTSSRVASAQAAIAQLRALLAHSASVSSLLSVQNEINTQEANLEALQSRQRALNRETSYATVTLLLSAKPPPAVKPPHHPGGFIGGLKAGWHGFGQFVSAVLTAAGAVLPFAVLAALAGYGAYRGRRWLLRQKGRTDQAAPGAAGPSPGQ